MPFLPVNKAELKALGKEQADIIIVSGDAYIDHPSFGTALIARHLESCGYTVGIIAQPDWHKPDDFLALGAPRFFFGVSSGNMDSMVNHYTAQRRLRSNDAYSPDGLSGLRPDRAVMVYTNMLQRLFKGVPIIIGGIEASLRRISHYDYWQDKVRNSILSDSKADLLVYGMAERPIVEIAKALSEGKEVRELTDIAGTVAFVKEMGSHTLPDADKCHDKLTFHQLNRYFYANYQEHPLFQKSGGRIIRHNPPATALSSEELDKIYSLPFMNAPHPMYKGKRIPAWEQIKDSITSHRGCYGGCNFCAIAIHQGRNIQSRTKFSILKEASKMKGTISDVGGPSANMYQSRCKLGFPASCKRMSCLHPNICPNLIFDHDVQIELLEDIARLPSIKYVFVASGIRHDIALKSKRYIKGIALNFTGGRLKLAPEHSSDRVLKLMRKPSAELFERFSQEYFKYLDKADLKRQIIPYLIIGHPGCDLDDAKALKSWLQMNHLKVEQVQEFTPTPMTISTCMYYTGLDFESGKPLHIPSPKEVRMQKELIVPTKKPIKNRSDKGKTKP